MSLLIKTLTTEQKKKYLEFYSQAQESALIAVKHHFPRIPQKTQGHLETLYKKGMKKGSDMFHKAVLEEYDNKTVINLAEKAIACDVRDVIFTLPKSYQEKKRTVLTDFYRKSIGEGAKQSYDTLKLLESFEQQNKL